MVKEKKLIQLDQYIKKVNLKMVILLNNEIDFWNKIVDSIKTNRIIITHIGVLEPLKEYIKFLCLVFISVKILHQDSVEYVKSNFAFAIRHTVSAVLLDSGFTVNVTTMNMIASIIWNVYLEYNRMHGGSTVELTADADGILHLIMEDAYHEDTGITQLPIGVNHILKVEYRFYKNDVGLNEFLNNKPFILTLDPTIVSDTTLVKDKIGYNFRNNVLYLQKQIDKNKNNPHELYDLRRQLNALKQTDDGLWEKSRAMRKANAKDERRQMREKLAEQAKLARRAARREAKSILQSTSEPLRTHNNGKGIHKNIRRTTKNGKNPIRKSKKKKQTKRK